MQNALIKGILIFLFTATCFVSYPDNPINRQQVVQRHNVITKELDKKSPAQVGNGEFAFSADITGLQTFVPFNTMSNWGWHSDPFPENTKIENFRGQKVDTYGRMVAYPLVNEDDAEQTALTEWMSGNPHRINLGRIAFSLKDSNGNEVKPGDLENCRQEIDLWSGIISSYFEIDGVPVSVKTACHPERDLIGVHVESDLINDGLLEVKLVFPFASAENSRSGDYIGVWNHPEDHYTYADIKDNQADFKRKLDEDEYYVSLRWFTEARIVQNDQNPHEIRLTPENRTLEFICEFSPKPIQKNQITTEGCMQESKAAWAEYWRSGAAVDLSGSEDPRWVELERRIVLSQYLMKVNEAGSLPPQESGLVRNRWYGKFHFEMVWWHGVHWALWNRWDKWESYLEIYRRFLKTAEKRAEREGFQGARWPKCTAYNNLEWPHPCHSFLIWQQPHPIYFAELDYRLHPEKETLKKWQEVVFSTADFLASIAHYDSLQGEYALGPPLIPVSENTKYDQTLNPAFELSYWRYGLKTAKKWYERLGKKPPAELIKVLENLAPLPVENELYVLHEGIRNMWTDYNYEHPALIGIYGMLPGEDVNLEILENTFDKILSVWDFERIWGWDFPMLAMTAARLDKPEKAIDLLLHENFPFDEHGYVYQGKAPYAYFPANGGLLAAVAMMAGGWDGANEVNAPGFPKNGRWKVKQENFNKIP